MKKGLNVYDVCCHGGTFSKGFGEGIQDVIYMQPKSMKSEIRRIEKVGWDFF